MIFNEIFDQCYQSLRGVASKTEDSYQRKRYNRALLALRSQNYFLSCSFQNVTGLAGVTGLSRTQALERPLIIRGGGMNAVFIAGDSIHGDIPAGGAVNVKVSRSGSSRAQISKETIRSSHYFSNGEAQRHELDWPVPWLLDKNEIILVNFEQESATNENQFYNVGFYGVAVDPQLRCEDWLLGDIRQQVLNSKIQKPRYIHLKTDKGGGTIVLPAIGNDERAVANTIEMPEHMLVLGWRRYMIGAGPETGGAALDTTMRLTVTGGNSFSRIEIPVNAFEYLNRPDDGYFRLSIPHFIARGSSLSLSVTSSITRQIDQFEGEIELLCVSV